MSHPDYTAIRIDDSDPKAIKAWENPTIRFGKGHILPDGCYEFEDGTIEAFETR